MDLPTNHFKQALRDGRQQIGIWSSLSSNYVAEAVAGAGFDWMVIDTEHSPTDATSVLPILQAVAPYEVTPVVRPASNDAVLIKRFLDLGAQTLLIPMVQSRAEAEAAVSAMRYPPRGIRGVAGTTRASNFGRIANYATRAEAELCLLVQIETVAGLEALEEIATTEGVHGVFIGPADLAASLGYPGQPGHQEVVTVIERMIGTLGTLGIPAGILTPDRDFARRCIELGTTFTAVGQDIGVLIGGARALREDFA